MLWWRGLDKIDCGDETKVIHGFLVLEWGDKIWHPEKDSQLFTKSMRSWGMWVTPPWDLAWWESNCKPWGYLGTLIGIIVIKSGAWLPLDFDWLWMWSWILYQQLVRFWWDFNLVRETLEVSKTFQQNNQELASQGMLPWWLFDAQNHHQVLEKKERHWELN